MSTSYLNLWFAIADDLPADMQLTISQLKEKGFEAQTHIEKLREILSEFTEDLSKEERMEKLNKYKKTAEAFVVTADAKQTAASTMHALIVGHSLLMDQKRTDFTTGAYIEKEAEAARDPSPEPKPLTSTRPAPASRSLPQQSSDRKRSRENDSIGFQQQQPVKFEATAFAGATGTAVAQAKKKARSAAKSKAKPVRREYCIPECVVQDGDMVGCDNSNCQNGEWFHLVCLGLRTAPPEDKKWYCPVCRDQMAPPSSSRGRR